jgi:hypothetical protein
MFEALPAAARARPGLFVLRCRARFTRRPAYRKTAFLDGPSRSVRLGVWEPERLSSRPVNSPRTWGDLRCPCRTLRGDWAQASGRSRRSDSNASSDWWTDVYDGWRRRSLHGDAPAPRSGLNPDVKRSKMAMGRYFLLVVEGRNEYTPPVWPQAPHRRRCRGVLKI